MNNIRQGAVSRLQILPEVFDLEDVEKTFQCSRNHAMVYCSGWRKQALIAPLASGKSGIYFNLIVNTNAPQSRLYEALSRLSSAPLILVGATALNAHGWTTQLPAVPEIAIRIEKGHESLPNIERALLAPRYPRWYSHIMDQAETMSIEKANVYIASAEMAVADAYLSNERNLGKGRMVWCPDYDDLDEDCLASGRDGIQMSLEKLGASETETDKIMSKLGFVEAPRRLGR